MRASLFLFFAAVCTTCSLSPAYASNQATGTINVVDPNSYYGGTFVQLNIPLSFVYEPGCVMSNFAFIPFNDPGHNAIVATLLAAKASGAVVVVYTIGCVTAGNGSSQAKIYAVDYGIRN